MAKKPSPKTMMNWANYGTLILFGALAYWKGPLLFENSKDPDTFANLIYWFTAPGLLYFGYRAYMGGSKNSLITAIGRPLVLAALVYGLSYGVGNLILAGVAGSDEGGIVDAEIQYLLDSAARQEGEKLYDGAELELDECLATADVPIEKEVCEIELARIYVEQVSYLVNDLEVCRQEDSANRLSVALAVANQYGKTDLERRVNDKLKDLEEVCEVTDIEIAPAIKIATITDDYEFEMLRSEEIRGAAYIDFRIIKNGYSLDGLDEDDFRLYRGDSNNELDYNFTARDSDDSVCIIAVVDNSGSIVEGISKIRNALINLNEFRKETDELGLVIFGNLEDVSIAMRPSLEDINPLLVNGSGEYTALWAGTELGIEAAQMCESPNRYLIVLTDGKDTTRYKINGKPADDLIAARHLSKLASDAEISICSVGIQSDTLNSDALKILATGCDYYETSRLDDNADVDMLVSKFSEIIGFVRDFYRVRISASEFSTGDPVYLQLLIDDDYQIEIELTVE